MGGGKGEGDAYAFIRIMSIYLIRLPYHISLCFAPKRELLLLFTSPLYSPLHIMERGQGVGFSKYCLHKSLRFIFLLTNPLIKVEKNHKF